MSDESTPQLASYWNKCLEQFSSTALLTLNFSLFLDWTKVVCMVKWLIQYIEFKQLFMSNFCIKNYFVHIQCTCTVCWINLNIWLSLMQSYYIIQMSSLLINEHFNRVVLTYLLYLIYKPTQKFIPAHQ